MAGAREPPPSAGEYIDTNPHTTDPPLLKDNSQFKTYKTSRFEYPDVRVFFRPHAKTAELPMTPAPLPLMVFVPGLGGSVAQFYPLLSSLVDLAPCLSMDFPGGGRSRYAVTSWDAYTPEALGELLELVIEDHRDKEHGQGIILIGHSMGTMLAVQLASRNVPHKTDLSRYVVALVAVCPTAGPPDEQRSSLLRRLLWVPGWMFSLWRAWDGIGGPYSPSVSRFVGQEADLELRVMQHRFNQQSRTPVWRRMAYGALPVYRDGKPIGGLPSLDAWAGVKVPVYLIAGEDDHLTPPEEVNKILKVLNHRSHSTQSIDDQTNQEQLGISSLSPTQISSQSSDTIYDLKEESFATDKTGGAIINNAHDEPSTPSESPAFIPPQPIHPTPVVQSFVMPSPANHALLYMPRCSRVLAGLISDFLACHVTQRLSLAWQLQYLSREGKWDVKNLIKWKSVAPVSEEIGPEGRPIFRAMKTLREADEVHCPSEFVEAWSSVVKDVIDISKDPPVYDPRGLERRGVHYHKIPTASKIPPQPNEVGSFIKLVDKLRNAQKERADTEDWEHPEKCVVGVHCHYGFNRTGYFIVSYLVERCGLSVQQAIEKFAQARPNGIRHSHFLDRLYVRYNVEEGPDQQQKP
ncbi:dual specificity phosphatase catalytic domain protein [Metarhizium album ARSEF 1941]|uniref:Dual specificity phosphatase catalytic domain protein n=1 Tax=Metarhizium album (strain ARSEF 1941) TaxID=1081103 RepID=A0A0B2X469_METAS|nr:dual specificity phosphatase catalytic domain protein [Metarhizium album ARSEF 1941]KHO01149.1 dual specificity phosphatase catalytic domain protein [Metarhizium album ARSEF 1941]